MASVETHLCKASLCLPSRSKHLKHAEEDGRFPMSAYFKADRTRHVSEQELTDLDDDCLLSIFSFLSPLPDLISLSKACRVCSVPADVY